MPENGMYLWHWYTDICKTRGYNEGGPIPINNHDILAWIAVSGNLINRLECDIIIKMDASFRAALDVEIKSNEAREAAKNNKG